MPEGISVFVESLANNRAGDVGIAPYRSIGARGVECGRKISRRLNIDRLSGRWIGRTDSVELKVPGDTALVNNVPSFYGNVTIEIDLDMYIRFNVNAASNVTGHVHCDVG